MARRALVLFSLLAALGWARNAERDYALILEDPPAAVKASAATRIRAAQIGVRAELARRQVPVTGSVNTLLNAVFVRATPEEAARLKALPGVKRVAWVRPVRHHLDRAVDLVNASAAWSAAGGPQNAGAGVKIAIIDTGIDHTHAAFNDPSLTPPPDFPKGNTEYTNGKIIVARSYVDQLPFPDDTSPRDRNGAGTAAAMIAAGVRNTGPIAAITGPIAAITGIAPRAWLGNYKIFGSTGINDTTRGTLVIQALEEAFNDGMDIAVLPLGDPATYDPLESDPDPAVCGGPCDVRAQAVETAVGKGMTVVVSAGNDGNLTEIYPTLNSIHTPGTAPSAITVGATTNSRMIFSSVHVAGGESIDAAWGDGPKPAAPVTAPLCDVARLQSGGLACAPLPEGSLAGAIALVQRGECAFADKVFYSEDAGAVGVVIIQNPGADIPIPPLGLAGASVPVVMIGSAAGQRLKSLLGSNPDQQVSIDAALHSVDTSDFNGVAFFSSRGPSIGSAAIKPEIVAVGADVYTATQKSDPTGALYDPSGYVGVSGTSFAAPMVAGAAALVKQAHPAYTPAQIKSALVNTASSDVTGDGAPARITAVGGGKLDARAAIASSVTVTPSTLSFGQITGGAQPVRLALEIRNNGGARVDLTAAVAPRTTDSKGRLTITSPQFALDPGQTTTLNVALEGDFPDPGSYEGYVTIQGAGAQLRIPYLYAVTDSRPGNAFPVLHGEFSGVVNDPIPWVIAFKLVDRFGLPVPNSAVRFSVVQGGGSVVRGDAATDKVGIAAAEVLLGPRTGDQIFRAEAGGLTVDFFGYAVAELPIALNAVVNAASFQAGSAAPGSYVTVLGSGLSESTAASSTLSLPLALGGASVTFEAGDLSVPGRLSYASDGQLNVQVPWELEGRAAADLRVVVQGFESAAYSVPLAPHAPALFEVNGMAAALDFPGNRLITNSNPAGRGQVVQLYVNGLGAVDNPPPSGEPASTEQLVRTRVSPVVTIGGRPAPVLFSGLAPGLVGLYQINVTVPADAPSGPQPVIIEAGGVQSKPVTLPVAQN